LRCNHRGDGVIKATAALSNGLSRSAAAVVSSKKSLTKFWRAQPPPEQRDAILTIMSGKAGGRSDMTRRKNDSLSVAAPNEPRQRLAGARRHKLVETRKDIEQRTDDAPEVDQLGADNELASH